MGVGPTRDSPGPPHNGVGAEGPTDPTISIAKDNQLIDPRTTQSPAAMIARGNASVKISAKDECERPKCERQEREETRHAIAVRDVPETGTAPRRTSSLQRKALHPAERHSCAGRNPGRCVTYPLASHSAVSYRATKRASRWGFHARRLDYDGLRVGTGHTSCSPWVLCRSDGGVFCSRLLLPGKPCKTLRAALAVAAKSKLCDARTLWKGTLAYVNAYH